nr:hypothetical protein [Myxococcota bacterium]
MNPSAEPARAALADHLMAIHPHTAAIVLERAEPDEVARWLDTREPVATTAVLARMVPERAARV